jgi:hypothetical protein
MIFLASNRCKIELVNILLITSQIEDRLGQYSNEFVQTMNVTFSCWSVGVLLITSHIKHQLLLIDRLQQATTATAQISQLPFFV